MNLQESFELHNELNPKLFKNEKLKPDIRQRILDIVDEFINTLWIKIDVLDIQLLGSNASYNYTDYSDLDIHIVTNFELLDASQEIVNALFSLEKTNFNRNYDIFIKQIPVELYIEDVNSGAVSNGIYSVKDDKWVKFPQKISEIPEYDISIPLNKWKNTIQKALHTGNKEELKNIVNTLYMIRKNSIAIDGEYGKGNQLFKELRNLGFVELVKEQIKKLTSKELSLEGMEENYYF